MKIYPFVERALALLVTFVRHPPKHSSSNSEWVSLGKPVKPVKHVFEHSKKGQGSCIIKIATKS